MSDLTQMGHEPIAAMLSMWETSRRLGSRSTSLKMMWGFSTMTAVMTSSSSAVAARCGQGFPGAVVFVLGNAEREARGLAVDAHARHARDAAA